MRNIEVTQSGNEVVIYVGIVDASGQYKSLRLTTAEAAVLMMKLQQSL